MTMMARRGRLIGPPVYRPTTSFTTLHNPRGSKAFNLKWAPVYSEALGRNRSMTRQRLAALALALVTFAGCHEDPKVQQVNVPGSATALAILTNGGAGSTTTNTAGVGKNGGNI